MPKLHHLRDFVAIAKAGSARGAARAVGLSQPALTRSLSELERELGVGLFERHARGMTLTAAGDRFLARAQAALEELRRGFEEVAQTQGRMQGSVAVALSSAVVFTVLPTACKAFRRECPDVRLRVVEGLFPAVEPRLRDGGLDFYMGPRPEQTPASSYRVDLLYRNERVVVGRKDHPLRHARSIVELLDAEWIVTGLRERIEQEFDEQFTALGVRVPQSSMVVESMLALLALLASGDGLAFLPRQWTDTPLLRGLVEPIAVAEPLIAPDIVLVSRATLPLTPAAERLSILLQRGTGQPFPRAVGR